MNYRILVAIVALALVVIFSQCSDETTPPDAWITIKITSPQNNSVISDSVHKITTSVTASCGCQRYVEFWIDDSLRYADYAGPFEYNWRFPQINGSHKIKTIAVLVGKTSSSDSVSVQIKK